MLIEAADVHRALKLHLNLPDEEIERILHVLGNHIGEMLERLRSDGVSESIQLHALLDLISQMTNIQTTKDTIVMTTTASINAHIELNILNADGAIDQRIAMSQTQTIIGRNAQVSFPEDEYLAPQHARLLWNEDQQQLLIKDLDSENGTFIQVKSKTALHNGSTFLLGRHVMRLQQVTTTSKPGDFSPNQHTRVMGSPRPESDWRLIRLGVFDEELAIHPLNETRPVLLGRDPQGDGEDAMLIAFPDDKYMSQRQAKLTFEDNAWFLEDTNSSNGVWLGLDTEQLIQDGDRIFLGKQLFEVSIDTTTTD